MHKSFHSLHALRRHLEIPVVNTGRCINLFGHAGLATDDIEGLHGLSDQDGFIRLTSGVELPTHLYRVQKKDWGECQPTLGRLKAEHDQLLNLCRRIAFEDALSHHPMVVAAERALFCGQPLFVDHEALSQHYEHPTDVLDVTSNFDVACFFATCTYNEQTARWMPFFSETDPGVIYRLNWVAMDLSESTQDRIGSVGWQPFPRPARQRAYAVKMLQGEDFKKFPSIDSCSFQHHPRLSHEVWMSFNKGEALFPRDPAAELSGRAKHLSSFTESQIDRAWQRLGEWNGHPVSIEQRHLTEASSAFQRVAVSPLNWEGLIDDLPAELWDSRIKDVLSRVRYRRAFYL